MKNILAYTGAVAILTILSVGCGPRPVVVEEKTTDQPAIEVERTGEPNDDKGVDVQIGGGQGVQVEVEGK